MTTAVTNEGGAEGGRRPRTTKTVEELEKLEKARAERLATARRTAEGAAHLGFLQLYVLFGAGRSLNAFRVFLWRAMRWPAHESPFPRPMRVGKHAVAWRRSEVEAWLASRPRAGSSEAA